MLLQKLFGWPTTMPGTPFGDRPRRRNSRNTAPTKSAATAETGGKTTAAAVVALAAAKVAVAAATVEVAVPTTAVEEATRLGLQQVVKDPDSVRAVV